MKRIAFFAAVGTLPLLAASCSGGSTATNTGAGGSAVTTVGGSSAQSGSGGTTSSSTQSNTGAIASGGTSGANTITPNTGGAATGGVQAAGGVSAALGGVAGTGGAQSGAGGKTSNTATGGKQATGGKSATGGASPGGSSAAGGKSAGGGNTGVGGTTAITSAPSGTRSAGCGKTTTLKSGRASITVPNVADTAREYILALPTNYDQAHAYRLVFAWHPWTGTAQMIQSGGYYGLQKEANNDAIFVAGDGLVYTQGSQSGPGWGNKDGEDVAFYHTMLDLFRNELCIDEDRIFSVGFSFGAMFSFTLGCAADSMLRAIVPMAGNTFTSGGCASGSRSVAVMAFIGLQDSLLDGHRQAVNTYATRDGCGTTTETMNPSWCDGLASNYLPCTCVNYQGCKDGYPVVSCEYTAGHQQAPNPGPIWDFIAQF